MSNLLCKSSNGLSKAVCHYGYKCCGDGFGGNYGKGHRLKRRTLKRRERRNWKRAAEQEIADDEDGFWEDLIEIMEASGYYIEEGY